MVELSWITGVDDQTLSHAQRGLARCDALLVSSDGLGLVPFVAEERARFAQVLGGADAGDQLRVAQQQYEAIGSTGHAERIGRELGA